MDWVTGIQNAINYIEEHLTEEISYEKVAEQAGCSNFYVQRIFGILCDVSLGEYIRNRRLTLAGNELNASDMKIIDIALKYGYENPESFGRAFLKFHGITPSEAKKDGSRLKSFSRLSVKIILTGGSMMDYRIVKRKAFDVIEKVEQHSIEDDINQKSIPRFWERSHMDGTIETLCKYATDKTFILGLCYANSADCAKTFDYAIGAEYSGEHVVPEGFRKNTIPEGTWAIFECIGAMPGAMQDMWHKITSEFFPISGYMPTGEISIEAYTQGHMSSSHYHSEIWIPVMKREGIELVK